MLATTTLGATQRARPASPGWHAEYQRRLVSADVAVRAIESRQRVFMAGMCSVPQTLLRALVARAAELHEVEIVQVLGVGDMSHAAPAMQPHLRVNTLFISPGMRTAVGEGRADFTTIFLSEIPELLRSQLRPDIALVQVSPPNMDGFCSFGVEVAVSKPAALAARTIIAEVNWQMPHSLGDSLIHISQLGAIVEADYALPELPMGSGDPIELAIGGHIAGLIEDGATLQMGIGGIPDGVLQSLRTSGVKDLGLHTEMFSDGVIELVERGVITNARKTLHPGKIVAGFVLGTQRLYSFIHNNPLVEMHPIDYVNDPFVIAQNEKMVAINAAIEVDFTGQVCADSLGHSLYSGVGGQVDFVRGAARSKGGKPIITLPSTARRGTISRIVPALRPGAGVVTSRNDVHYVVTEYGVAYLHGRTIRERVQALIAVAHPAFRDQLTARAKELRYI